MVWSNSCDVFCPDGGSEPSYSCITSRNHLPLVSLALPETIEDGCYRVPNQAVQEQGYRHLFVVEEEQGAWGKEYVCREILLPNVSNEGQTTLIYADLEGFQWWSAVPSRCMTEPWVRLVLKGGRKMNEKRLWKLFLLPSLGGVLVFYLLPFVLSLYYGMIDNMGSRQFVGLQNVVETLKNPMFLQAAGNTAVYLGLSIPLILLFSLGLALLLHLR